MNKERSETAVVIPTYNNTFDDLYNAVTSVINQKLPVEEIIIVDDGSTNKVPDEIIKIITPSNDTRIKLFKKKNEGPSSARNYGLKNCSSKYITFLDSDDQMLPDNILIKTNELKKTSTDYFGVYGTFIMMPENSVQEHINFDGIPLIDDIDKKNGIPGGVHSYLFRKKHLEEIGGFDNSLINNEDYDLIIRLIKKNKKCKGNFGPGFIRNYREGSLSRNSQYFTIYKNTLRFLDKASKLNYFSKKEQNNRYANNEYSFSRHLILNKKYIDGLTHLYKAYKHSKLETIIKIKKLILRKLNINQ